MSRVSTSSDVTVPLDLTEAPVRDAVARARFEGLAPSHRREWVRWIEEAKRAETRARRIDRTVSALREGAPAQGGG